MLLNNLPNAANDEYDEVNDGEEYQLDSKIIVELAVIICICKHLNRHLWTGVFKITHQLIVCDFINF